MQKSYQDNPRRNHWEGRYIGDNFEEWVRKCRQAHYFDVWEAPFYVHKASRYIIFTTKEQMHLTKAKRLYGKHITEIAPKTGIRGANPKKKKLYPGKLEEYSLDDLKGTGQISPLAEEVENEAADDLGEISEHKEQEFEKESDEVPNRSRRSSSDYRKSHYALEDLGYMVDNGVSLMALSQLLTQLKEHKLRAKFVDHLEDLEKRELIRIKFSLPEIRVRRLFKFGEEMQEEAIQLGDEHEPPKEKVLKPNEEEQPFLFKKKPQDDEVLSQGIVDDKRLLEEDPPQEEVAIVAEPEPDLDLVYVHPKKIWGKIPKVIQVKFEPAVMNLGPAIDALGDANDAGHAGEAGQAENPGLQKAGLENQDEAMQVEKAANNIDLTLTMEDLAQYKVELDKKAVQVKKILSPKMTKAEKEAFYQKFDLLATTCNILVLTRLIESETITLAELDVYFRENLPGKETFKQEHLEFFDLVHHFLTWYEKHVQIMRCQEGIPLEGTVVPNGQEYYEKNKDEVDAALKRVENVWIVNVKRKSTRKEAKCDLYEICPEKLNIHFFTVPLGSPYLRNLETYFGKVRKVLAENYNPLEKKLLPFLAPYYDQVLLETDPELK